jgi:tetratricopeptide (TPR) repeat protein
MKSLTLALVFLAVGVIGGMFISRNWQTPPSTPTPVVESRPSPMTVETHPEKVTNPKPELPRNVSVGTNDAKPTPVAAAPANDLKPAISSSLSQAVDTLVSPQASFQQKRAALKQLRDEGELDQAIELLKQGAANNPASAAYPAALGQVELQKAGVVSQNGGSVNEMGILGMQADQNFDAALKLDPANWEAQFYKAAAMSYWPPELNKSPEVIQRLASLIDQQETMPPQPQFAQTYVLLGDQYQKAGQPDYAQQTWQLGAAQFPGDPTLQKKIAGSRTQ